MQYVFRSTGNPTLCVQELFVLLLVIFLDWIGFIQYTVIRVSNGFADRQLEPSTLFPFANSFILLSLYNNPELKDKRRFYVLISSFSNHGAVGESLPLFSIAKSTSPPTINMSTTVKEILFVQLTFQMKKSIIT
jgi:hypothetical protein